MSYQCLNTMMMSALLDSGRNMSPLKIDSADRNKQRWSTNIALLGRKNMANYY